MANVAHVDYYEVLSVTRECGEQELKKQLSEPH